MILSKYYCYFCLLAPSLLTVANGQLYCEPCSNGEIPFATDDTCSTLSAAAMMLRSGTQECTEKRLELFQSDCCTQPPLDSCTLCPDGRVNIMASLIVVPNFEPLEQDMTCANIPWDGSFLESLFETGTCDDTMLRRSAAWCGCSGVSRQCSLCPNGERPPNPSLIDPVYYGWDCDTFDYVSSFFSTEECSGLVDTIFEFDAPSYCGCADAPIPNICHLCPDGQVLLNPHLLLEDEEKQFTCRDLALSTRYIPDIEPCTRVLAAHAENGYIEDCCAPIELVPIRLGGTATSGAVVGRALYNVPWMGFFMFWVLSSIVWILQ